MTINLTPYPSQPYIGVPFGLAVAIAGKSAYAVPLSFEWITYGASAANPNVVASVNLNTGQGASPRPPLDALRSAYIDNTGCPVPVYVQFPDTGYTITAQPYSTGWYPIFTNLFACNVAALGLTNQQAANLAQTTVYLTNIKAPPFTDIALPQALQLQKASASITRGGTIYNTNYDVPALGDQFVTTSCFLTGPSAPELIPAQANGFLYLTFVSYRTNFAIGSGSGTQGSVTMFDETTGDNIAPSGFFAPTIAAAGALEIFRLQNCNIKLDATHGIGFKNNGNNLSDGTAQCIVAYTLNPT